jgi:hypothetical protein
VPVQVVPAKRILFAGSADIELEPAVDILEGGEVVTDEAFRPGEISFFIADPIGWNERPERLEEARRKGVIPAELLGLGDETEHALRIPCSERDHGPSKDMTNDQ